MSESAANRATTTPNEPTERTDVVPEAIREERGKTLLSVSRITRIKKKKEEEVEELNHFAYLIINSFDRSKFSKLSQQV
jgi:hypothetical protein